MSFLVLNKIIGTPDINFATYRTNSAGTTHAIFLGQEGLPQGKKALPNAAWYFPVDNLKDFAAFTTIDVEVAGDDKLTLVLKQRDPKVQGALRIKIVVGYQ
jgi:hypothetical protein